MVCEKCKKAKKSYKPAKKAPKKDKKAPKKTKFPQSSESGRIMMQSGKK